MATHTINRVAIYARISTTNHGQDVTWQTRELEQFAQARGRHAVGSYVDAGVSGSKDSRPELNRLMADAHKRVPLYQLFYEGEEPPKLPNLLKGKSSDELAWGSSGKEARFVSKLRRSLGKSDLQHRNLILQLAQKMAVR